MRQKKNNTSDSSKKNGNQFSFLLRQTCALKTKEKGCVGIYKNSFSTQICIRDYVERAQYIVTRNGTQRLHVVTYEI